MRIICFTYVYADGSCSRTALTPIFDNKTGEYVIFNPSPWTAEELTRDILKFLFDVLSKNFSDSVYEDSYTIDLETDFGPAIYQMKKYQSYHHWFFTEEFYHDNSKLAWSNNTEYCYRSSINNERVYGYKKRNQSMFVELSQRRQANYPLPLDATICFFAEEIEKIRKYVRELSQEEKQYSLVYKEFVGNCSE